MMPTIPKDLKDVKVVREFLAHVASQLCSRADLLGEPWKSHFLAIKGQYDDVLKQLPPTDQVPAGVEADRNLCALFSCLASTDALVAMLSSSMQGMLPKASLNSAIDDALKARIASGDLLPKDQVGGAVSVELERRVKAGELVAKETVTQLCSEAKTVGVTEGRKAVMDEVAAEKARQARIGERKVALQTAGLPVPDGAIEGVLAGTDEEFIAVKKTAEDRITGLQKQGVALNAKSPLLQKVWLPKEQWEVFESLAIETIKGGNPLAGAGAGADKDKEQNGRLPRFIC